MSQPETVRVGIIGAGGIVQARHLPGLRAIDGVEVVAVSNRSEASSRRVAQKWDIPHVAPDWQSLVARDDIDAVLIGTWPYLHCPVTLAALEAGKHVFCQARMAMNLDEAGKMLRSAMKSDRVTMLCPPPHGLPGDRVIQRLIEQEYVGAARLIRLTSLSGAVADPAVPLTWRQDRALSGRNVLTLGIYAEVIHRWLGHAKRLVASMQTFVATRPSADGSEVVQVEIPDALDVVGQMESGAELCISMSGAVPCGPQDTLEIYGDCGGLIYNFVDNTIRGTRDDEPWHEIAIPPDDVCQWTVEEDFIAAIRAGKEAADIHPDFHDGYRYMEFVEAVWMSHHQRRHVDLPMNI